MNVAAPLLQTVEALHGFVDLRREAISKRQRRIVQCRRCWYFLPSAGEADGNPEVGVCRFSPPIHIIESTQTQVPGPDGNPTQAVQQQAKWMFGRTGAFDYCSKWRPWAKLWTLAFRRVS
ncbi:hypothetical protein HN371_00260 [Candidatus Poribacteria bacterium]|jgi:hypothetical protein|nr:hypothetical protein [Candidatus Poribacteria bacterium]MBT7096603.1 hypothetical protein [Candidatus Poribacteria bacterium]